MFLRAAISLPRASPDKNLRHQAIREHPSRAFLFESTGEAGSLHSPGGGLKCVRHLLALSSSQFGSGHPENKRPSCYDYVATLALAAVALALADRPTASS